MLWGQTPVFDPASGKMLYVRHLAAHQPDLDKEIFRATVSEQLVGFADAKEVVVGKFGGRWTVFQSAEGRSEPSDHPFLDRFENDYIAIVRNILEQLEDQYQFIVTPSIERDSDDRWELSAFTQFRAKPGCSPEFFPDASSLDFIAGARAIERSADTFPLTMGLTAGDGYIPGEFEMIVGLSSLILSYEVEGWKLTVSSLFEGERWAHKTTLLAPPIPDISIVDALKYEALNPSEKLAFRSSECPFSEEFPKIAAGQVPVISIEDDGENCFFHLFHLVSSEIR
jgi:hypothetical protein